MPHTPHHCCILLSGDLLPSFAAAVVVVTIKQDKRTLSTKLEPLTLDQCSQHSFVKGWSLAGMLRGAVRLPMRQLQLLTDPPVAKDKSLPPQNIHDAISLIRQQARARFVETVEIAVKLNVDPRKQAQNVKGIASLPRGLGKQIRVGAFCVGADIDLAKSAGADLAGAEDLIKVVQGGEIPFDRVVATPEIMTKLSRIGKVWCDAISTYLFHT